MWEFTRVIVCSMEIFGGCELMGPSGTVEFDLFGTESECKVKIEEHMRKAILNVYGNKNAKYMVICKRVGNMT